MASIGQFSTPSAAISHPWQLSQYPYQHSLAGNQTQFIGPTLSSNASYVNQQSAGPPHIVVLQSPTERTDGRSNVSLSDMTIEDLDGMSEKQLADLFDGEESQVVDIDEKAVQQSSSSWSGRVKEAVRNLVSSISLPSVSDCVKQHPLAAFLFVSALGPTLQSVAQDTGVYCIKASGEKVKDSVRAFLFGETRSSYRDSNSLSKEDPQELIITVNHAFQGSPNQSYSSGRQLVISGPPQPAPAAMPTPTPTEKSLWTSWAYGR